MLISHYKESSFISLVELLVGIEPTFSDYKTDVITFILKKQLYLKGDLNPYSHYWLPDFKSDVSTYSTI